MRVERAKTGRPASATRATAMSFSNKADDVRRWSANDELTLDPPSAAPQDPAAAS
ncbi:MAG: hypothetical protein R3C54_06630 [Parvularculaceae bacterium]